MSINFKARIPFLALAVAICMPAPKVHAEPESPVTVFEENFNSYKGTAAFKKFWPEGNGVLITNPPGGGKAIQHNGARLNRHAGFNFTPDPEHNLVLSADFYDFGTNTDRRVAVSLRNANSNLLAIGLVGTSPYVVKAVGYTAKTNWVAFKRGQLPVPGWHHMQVTLSMSNVVATINPGSTGKANKKLIIPLTSPPPTFSEVCLGGVTRPGGWRSPVLVENIKVQMVPVAWKLPLYTPRPAPAPTEPVASKSNLTETTIAREITTNNSAEAKLSPVLATNQTAVRPTEVAVEHPPSPSVAQTASVGAAFNSALWAICAALAIIVGLLAYVLIVLRRATAGAYRNPEAPLALGHAGSGQSSLALREGAENWRNRAIAAEALAAKQAQILQEKVGPELVEFAKETLVQGLYKQRTALAQTQASAQEALVDLEKRLSDLDLPARDRLHAYEKRIAELEKDLETRNDEMRELTKATLILMRKKMQEEREGSGQKFN